MGKYSSVISALVTRINAHIGTGKILDGFKFHVGPLQEVEGEKDYPTIRLWVPDLSQAIHARLVGQGGMTLKISVASSRKIGLVAWVQDVEKVLDAIETDPATADVDLSLGGSLQIPMLPQVGNNFATPDGLSINAQITISVMPKLFTRGARRL